MVDLNNGLENRRGMRLIKEKKKKKHQESQIGCNEKEVSGS